LKEKEIHADTGDMKKHARKTDRYFMGLAIRKAAQGIGRRQTPFGACIVLNGKNISCEHNVVWKTTDITMHAEIHALRTACRRLGTVDLAGATIYSTCEPCPMCFSACHWAGISRIVYGTSIRDAARIGFRELAVSNRALKRMAKSPVRITGGFMRREALGLFERFERVKRGRLY